MPSTAAAAERQMLGMFERAAASPSMVTPCSDSTLRSTSPSAAGDLGPTLVIHRGRPDPIEYGRCIADRVPGAFRRAARERPPALGGDSEAVLDEVEQFLTGVATAEPERMLGTVLFTDIAGSTERAASSGTIAGELCSRATTTWSAASWPRSADARSRPWATASSPSSTARSGDPLRLRDSRGRGGARHRGPRRRPWRPDGGRSAPTATAWDRPCISARIGIATSLVSSVLGTRTITERCPTIRSGLLASSRGAWIVARCCPLEGQSPRRAPPSTRSEMTSTGVRLGNEPAFSSPQQRVQFEAASVLASNGRAPPGARRFYATWD